ncbi:MAG: YigZ family protein [Cyclobacteriaceae bacterium]|nr:YigZ family protein [Cyclobacteriaceae bacterium]
MPVHSFQTIQHPAEGLYKEKGSKFLAFAFPVSDENEIKCTIESIKKKYFDARHHCYAWMLGAEKKRFRAVDDGEPNHSAGDPILGQIRSKDITNVLIIVVRYFGGVKLGVGGLVAAYKAAAEDALRHAHIIEQQVTKIFTITFVYAATPQVMRLVKDFDLEIMEQHFSDSCVVTLKASLQHQERMLESLRLMQAMGTQLSWEEQPESD